MSIVMSDPAINICCRRRDTHYMKDLNYVFLSTTSKLPTLRIITMLFRRKLQLGSQLGSNLGQQGLSGADGINCHSIASLKSSTSCSIVVDDGTLLACDRQVLPFHSSTTLPRRS